MDTVYIETSVISHATASKSYEPSNMVLQEQARQWMREEGPKYKLVTSQLVIEEASRGDAEAARLRLDLLKGIPVLPAYSGAVGVANLIIAGSMMPAKARLDACTSRPQRLLGYNTC